MAWLPSSRLCKSLPSPPLRPTVPDPLRRVSPLMAPGFQGSPARVGHLCPAPVHPKAVWHNCLCAPSGPNHRLRSPKTQPAQAPDPAPWSAAPAGPGSEEGPCHSPGPPARVTA